MHVAGREHIRSGSREATSQYLCTGECVHFPAQAWARLGDRELIISADEHPGLEPHQLVAKCEALLRRGVGWKI